MGIADRWTPLLPARREVLEHYRLLTPVFPALLDSVRLPPAGLVVSSSYAFAHRLRSISPAPVACFCHSPLRFAWTMTDEYADQWAARSGASRAVFGAFAAWMRQTDRHAARRIGRYMTQSPFIAAQIQANYGRSAEVIGAPINCDAFVPAHRAAREYFLLCGRLIEPYKRPGIVIDAFRSLPHRLLVVGDGPALAGLRRDAPANVEFTGALDDRGVVEAMQGAIAGIFPSCDDFGLIPLEFMACGRPVIAYGAGGALHTVLPGVTGEFLHEQTADAVAAAVQAFDVDVYDPVRIRNHALRWDRRAFRARLAGEVLPLAGQ
jgi:glycosyltransferase involved in cell wall biosynthesis